MNEELTELLKKALKDASGQTFYKLDGKTFSRTVFDLYCEEWFKENEQLIAQVLKQMK